MSDTMIERMARALMALDYPEEAGGEMGEFYMDRHGDTYRAQARAVLAVMREPTEAMVDGAGEVVVSPRQDWQSTVRAWFVAMIDAALAEEG